MPTISLPLLTGENNLPLGIQLVGNKLDDLRFLGTANWLEKIVKMNSKLTTIIGCGLCIAFLIGLATTLTRSMMIGFKDVLLPVYILMGLVIVMMLYEAFFDKKSNLYPYLLLFIQLIFMATNIIVARGRS